MTQPINLLLDQWMTNPVSRALLAALAQARIDTMNQILNTQETGSHSPELQKLIGEARAYRKLEDIKTFIEYTIDEVLQNDKFGI